jgi:hypothetical protein
MPKRKSRIFSLMRGMNSARNTGRRLLFLEELRRIASEEQTWIYV